MANKNAPQGFSPVGTLSGAAWNEKGRLYAVANDASNTYAIGDVVKAAPGADADGVRYVTKLTNGGAAGNVPLGIIVGIRPVDPGVSLQGNTLSLENVYLGKSSGTRYVYVVDDPNVIFEAQFDSTAVALTDLGKNAAYTVTADQTSTLSQTAPYSNIVLTSPNTGVTYPIRLLGLVQRPETTGSVGAYAKVLCKFNFHEYGMAPVASGAAGA